eukprot:tig00000455_g1057.t1
MRKDDSTVKDLTGVKIIALPRNKLTIGLGAQPPVPLFSSNTYWNGAKMELVWTSETYGVFRGYQSYAIEVRNAADQLVATLAPPGGAGQPALDSFSASTAGGRLVFSVASIVNSISAGSSATYTIKIQYANKLQNVDTQDTVVQTSVQVGRRPLTELSLSSSASATAVLEIGDQISARYVGTFWASFAYTALNFHLMSGDPLQVVRTENSVMFKSRTEGASVLVDDSRTWTVPALASVGRIACGGFINHQLRATLAPSNANDIDGVRSASFPIRLGLRDVPKLVLNEIPPAEMPIFADDPIRISWRNERKCGQTTQFTIEFWDPSNPSSKCSISQSYFHPSPYSRELDWGSAALACPVLDNIPQCTQNKAISLRVTTVYQAATYSTNTITVSLTRVKKRSAPPLVFRGAANTEPYSWSFWSFSINGQGMLPHRPYTVSWLSDHCETNMEYRLVVTNAANTAETCTIPSQSTDGKKGGSYAFQFGLLAAQNSEDNAFVAQTPYTVTFGWSSTNGYGTCWPVTTPFSDSRRHVLELPDGEDVKLPPSPARARSLKQTTSDLWIEAPTREPTVGEPVTFTAKFDATKFAGYSFFWVRIFLIYARSTLTEQQELDIGGATAQGQTATFMFTSAGVATVILQASKPNAQDPTVQDATYAFFTVESKNRAATAATTATNLLPGAYTETLVKPPALSSTSPEVLATAKVLVGLATGVTVTGPDLVEACSETPASFSFGTSANASIAYPVTLRVAFGDGSAAETRAVTGAQAWPVLQKSYAATGTFEVRVTATNSAGESSAVFYVTSIAGPPRGLTANVSSTTVRTGQNVSVSASRTAGCGPVQYWVDWGEMVAAEEFMAASSGVHSFLAYGKLNITVKAHSPEGNSSMVIPIEVLPSFPSEISIKTEGTPVAGRPIKAMAFAEGDDPMTFLWTALSAGDGFAITDTYTNTTVREMWGQEVQFTPSSPGSRAIRVQAFNPAGNASSEFVLAVNGAPPSTPKIRILYGAVNFSSPVEGVPVDFSADVESGNGPFAFEWTIESVAVDGERWLCKRAAADSTASKSTGATPVVTHKFTDGGPKRVTVTVTSAWGAAQGSLDFDVAGAEPTSVSVSVAPAAVIVGENTTISVSWAGTGPFDVALTFPSVNFTVRSSSIQRTGDCRFQSDFVYYFPTRGATLLYAAVMNSRRLAVANFTVDALWSTPARRGILASDADPCPSHDRCGTCGGSNACVDCAGVVNGGLRRDECGVCGGDGTTCKGCDGAIDGKTYDACNVCGGDNTACRPVLAASNPLFPTSGNRRSPVTLTIRGTNFLATEDLACLFDGMRVAARLVRSPDDLHAVLCTAPLSPTTGAVSVVVEFTRVAHKVALGVQAVHTFHTTPVTYTYRDGVGALAAIVPASAPAFGAGSTSVTVFGSGLIQADGNAFVQVGDLRVRPTNFSQDGCSFAFSLPRKGATDPYEQTLTYFPDGREAAENPRSLSYYNYPDAAHISPSRGWMVVSSPSAIRLVGKNLGGLPKEARCRWSISGAAAGSEVEVEAIRTESGVSCPAPVPVRQSEWGTRGAAGLLRLGANCVKPASGPCACQPTAAPSNNPPQSFDMPLPDSAFAGGSFALQVALAPDGVTYAEDKKLDFVLYPRIEVVSVSPARVPASGGSQLTLTLSQASYSLLRPLLVDASVFLGGVECSGLTLSTSALSLSCVTGAMSTTGAAPIAFSLSPGSGRSPASGAAASVTVIGDPVVSWGAAPTPVLASIHGGIPITVRATTDGSAAFSFADSGLPKCAVAFASSPSAPLEILASLAAVSAADGSVDCGTLPDLQRVVSGASLPQVYSVTLSITNGASWSQQSAATLAVYDAMSPAAALPPVAVFAQTASVFVTGRLYHVQGRTRCVFNGNEVDALAASTSDAIVCPTAQLAKGTYTLAISLGSPRDVEKSVSVTVISPFTVTPISLPTCISVAIGGSTFTNTGSALRCRAQWGTDKDAVAETVAGFVSASSILCTLPNLGESWTGGIALSVALDGVSFTNAGAVSVWDDTRPPSLGSIAPSTASSSVSSATVTLYGSNFNPNGQLTCLWTDLAGAVTSTAATFRDSISATCSAPPYSSNSNRKTLQLRIANSASGEASPGHVEFTYVLANAATCTVDVPGSMEAGSTVTFTAASPDADPDITFKIVITPISTQRSVQTRTIVTDKGAQASVSYTQAVAGQYSVEVLLGTQSIQTKNLVVTPAAASFGVSSVSVSVRSRVAGSITGSASAVIRDAFGNSIGGKSVLAAIRSAVDDSVAWSSTVSTGADGTASVDLSAATSVQVAGSYVLTVSMDGSSLPGGLQTFDVVPGAPSASKTVVSFLGCSPLAAGGSCNVDVLVRDANENVIASGGSTGTGLDVVMQVFEADRNPAAATADSSSPVSLDTCSFPTYTVPASSAEVQRSTVTLSRAADGVAFRAVLSMTKATTYRVAVSLRIDGNVVALSLPPAPHVTVVAGEQSGVLLEERERSASFSPSFAAGVGRACLTFAALDSYGNARNGVASVFPWTLELTGSPSTNLSETTIAPSPVSLGAGRYGVAVGSTLAGSFRLTLAGGFAPLVMTVTPSDADPSQTVLSVASASAPTAGSELALRISIRDAYRNAIDLATWGSVGDLFAVAVAAVGETRPAASAFPPSVQLDYTPAKDAVLARLLVVPAGSFRVSVSMRSSTASAFAQSASVVVPFQPAAAPAISRAIFAPTGDAIDVLFDADTDTAGMVDPNSGFVASQDCARVLSASTLMFLEGATCAWPSPSLLVVSIGRASSVMPGDNIAVKAGVLFTSVGNSLSSTASSTLLAPLRPLEPSATAVAPPVISACSELVLQALSVSGGGNRDVALSWSSRVVSPQGAAATAVAEALAAAIAAQQGRSSVNLTAVVPNLPDNAEIEFSLSARNFFGNRGPVSSVFVSKRSDLTVSTSIRGPSPISVRRSATMDLWAEVALASCQPVADLLPRLKLAWSAVDAPGIDLASAADVTSRQLRLDLTKLDTRHIASLRLQFRAELPVDGSTTLISTSAVLLTFAPSPISVTLDKSGTILQATHSGLSLAATATDPDSATTSDWTYAWTCVDSSGSLCAGSDFLGAETQSAVVIPGSFFQTAGAAYSFTVTVRSASKKAVFDAGSYAKASIGVSVFPADSVPAADKSFVSIPHSMLADSTAIFQVTARDEDGSAPTQPGVSFTIIVSPKSTQRPRPVRTFSVSVGQDGNGTMTFAESVAGEYEVQVLLGGASVASSPYTLHVQPAAADPVSSAVIFTWGALEAGAPIGVASATIRDRFGNIIAGQSVTFAVTGPDALAPWTSSKETSSSGTVSVNLPTGFTKAGAYVASATVAGEHISGSSKAFSIAPSTADSAASALAVDPAHTQVVAGAQVGIATVTVRDRFGNAVDGASVVFAITKSGAASATWMQTVTSSSGAASATLPSLSDAGSYELTAKLGSSDVDKSPLAFSVVPAAVDASKTVVTLSGCSGMLAGDDCTVTAVVRDQFDNVIVASTGGLTVSVRLYKSAVGSVVANQSSTRALDSCSFPSFTVSASSSESLETTVQMSASADGTSSTAAFTLNVATAYRLEVDVNGAPVPTIAPFTVSAAAQSLGNTILEERAANPQFHPSIEAGSGRVCLTFVAYDGLGNVRFDANSHFAWALAPPTTATTAWGPVSLGAGRYGFAIASELAGEFQLSLAQGFDPLSITVTPSTPDSTESALAVDPAPAQVVAGAQVGIATVTVRDRFGNAVDGASVVFAITKSGAASATWMQTVTSSSGAASATLPNLSDAGSYELTAKLGSSDVDKSPLAFSVVPAAANATKSEVTFDGCADQVLGASQTCSATVVVRDTFNNAVQDGTTVGFVIKRALHCVYASDTKPEPVAQPLADGNAKPKPVAEPVAEPLADGDAEPEPVAQPLADGDAEPEPVAQPLADGDAEPEPVAEPLADGDAEPEPVAQPLADGDAKPKPVAEPVAEPLADGDAEPEPVAQPLADGDAEPEPVAQPLADGDAEPEPVAQPVAEPLADGDAEPEPVAQPLADGDAEPEPVAQPLADGDAEPEPVAQPLADGDAKPKPVAEPVAEPLADGDAEPEPVAEPLADGDVEPEPLAQPLADGDAEPEPVAQPLADGDAEPKPVAEPVADRDAEPKPVAEPVADGDAEPEPVAQSFADGDAEPEPVAQPFADGDAEPEPVAQPFADGDAEPEPVAEPLADGDAEPEPVAEPLADGDAEPEPLAQPVAQPLADGDAEPKPVAQPFADGDAEPKPVAQPFAGGDAEPKPVAEPVAERAANLLACNCLRRARCPQGLRSHTVRWVRVASARPQYP